ncbi:MAG TPA: hypothetical protein VHV56_02100 [Pseudolabrys sp.]|jgi:hypothetical protein|nr:hypothetical protein [Pseudolabrys sp.]
MTSRIPACLWALLCLTVISSDASAGVWAWGCQGQLGGQQLIFNRYSMYVVEGKTPLGNLHKLLDQKIDGLIKGESTGYDPNNGNDGLDKTITANRTGDDKRKITLTELSSKKTSHKHRVICHRDEDTDIFRKVYRYRREDEPARAITMQCIEYQLTTTGGRPNCD